MERNSCIKVASTHLQLFFQAKKRGIHLLLGMKWSEQARAKVWKICHSILSLLYSCCWSIFGSKQTIFPRNQDVFLKTLLGCFSALQCNASITWKTNRYTSSWRQVFCFFLFRGLFEGLLSWGLSRQFQTVSMANVSSPTIKVTQVSWSAIILWTVNKKRPGIHIRFTSAGIFLQPTSNTREKCGLNRKLCPDEHNSRRERASVARICRINLCVPTIYQQKLSYLV